MKNTGLKTTLVRGLTLAVPVVVITYVFIRITGIFEKMIGPVAEKMGIDKIFGQLTLTIIALLIIILLILLLGLMMQIPVVANMGKETEAIVLKFIPSLNQLKVMAADKLNIENSQNAWKPVIVLLEQKYNGAFIIEESNDLITLFVSKGTSLQEGEIVTTQKKEVSITPVTYDELHKCSKAFGKGYISLIKVNGNKKNEIPA
jgi:uncharacterized membrane protein